MKAANYAPMYCALYPELAELARAHGYALAVHGTLGRDMDLICVPWVDRPSEPITLVEAITTTFAARAVGGPPTKKPHGREAWTLSIGFGECAIDLSFIPRYRNLAEEEIHDIAREIGDEDRNGFIFNKDGSFSVVSFAEKIIERSRAALALLEAEE